MRDGANCHICELVYSRTTNNLVLQQSTQHTRTYFCSRFVNRHEHFRRWTGIVFNAKGSCSWSYVLLKRHMCKGAAGRSVCEVSPPNPTFRTDLLRRMIRCAISSNAARHCIQILMVEPPLNERARRQEMATMMFETFKVRICLMHILHVKARHIRQCVARRWGVPPLDNQQ